MTATTFDIKCAGFINKVGETINNARQKVVDAKPSKIAYKAVKLVDRTCMEVNKGMVQFLVDNPGINAMINPSTVARSVAAMQTSKLVDELVEKKLQQMGLKDILRSEILSEESK